MVTTTTKFASAAAKAVAAETAVKTAIRLVANCASEARDRSTSCIAAASGAATLLPMAGSAALMMVGKEGPFPTRLDSNGVMSVITRYKSGMCMRTWSGV
jgi:guanyl-specific ribonuclease Sa